MDRTAPIPGADLPVRETLEGQLAARLNEACQCIWVDRVKLRDQFRANLGDAASLFDSRPGLVSGSVVFLAAEEAAAMDRTASLIARALTSAKLSSRRSSRARPTWRADPGQSRVASWV